MTDHISTNEKEPQIHIVDPNSSGGNREISPHAEYAKYIDDQIEREIKEKALTNILDIVKFELKEEEENFKMLPLSDFQKEELLFDYLKDNKNYNELYSKYQDVRAIYNQQKKQKEKDYKSLQQIKEETAQELEEEEDKWDERLSPTD